MPNDEDTHRISKSQRFITKVILLAPVIRLRWNLHNKAQFDGKFGISPFFCTEAAQRNLKRSCQRNFVTKPIEVTKEIYERTLIETIR